MSEDGMTTALIVMAETLRSATLVGNPAPVVQRLFEWMNAPPQPGDTVVEMSTSFRGPTTERIGVFERHETRSVCHHELHDVNLERCAVCTEDERWSERFTWIRRIDSGAEVARHRWYNCSFIRVPVTPEQRKAALDSPPVPTSIDRPALVGML